MVVIPTARRSKQNQAQYLKIQQPRTFITSGGFGAMGFGLGAAIGAKMANPDKIVVNVAADVPVLEQHVQFFFA